MTARPKQNRILNRFNGFDIFVLAGGAMNLIVITYLVGYWLLH